MKHLQFGDWFILGIVFLQFCAVISYACKKRWLEVIIYGCYMTAQVMLLLLSIRSRA